MDVSTEPFQATGESERFLAAIEARARLPHHVSARIAATVAICTLATRLTRGQAYQLLAGLPPSIQPLFRPCLEHRYGPTADLDDAAFLQRISDRLDVSPSHAELICDSVFRAIRSELPHDVVEHVTMQLPHDLRDLWSGRRDVGYVDPDARPHEQLLLDIASTAQLPPWITARDAFASVICILSQRLSGGEARDVFLGLPDPVRPPIERCVYHRDEIGVLFDRAQLVASVADDLGTTTALAEQIVPAVLAAVKRVLPAKEVSDVESQLPVDLRDLWISA